MIEASNKQDIVSLETTAPWPDAVPKKLTKMIEENKEQDLMTPETAAPWLCTTPKTLAKWRSTGENNLPYRKLGKKVLYSRKDLQAYLDKHSYNAVQGGV